MSGTYGVFIIESMDFHEEMEGSMDGFVLKQMLDLMRIPNEYFFIRTKRELIALAAKFEASGFSYLHLSCHGNDSEIGLTLDSVSFQEFATIFGEHLYRKRMFVSACEIACFDFAKELIPKYHCLSIIGSPDEPTIPNAAIFWSCFYHLMKRDQPDSMSQKFIKRTLEAITSVFGFDINYFSIIKSSNPRSLQFLRLYPYRGGKPEKPTSMQTPHTNIHRLDETEMLGLDDPQS